MKVAEAISEHEELNPMFTQRGIPKPDVIFRGDLLDRAVRKETGEELPLRATKENNYYHTGCYAFIETGEDDEPEVMYVGKAAKLGNRLTYHWRNEQPNFLFQWCDDRAQKGLGFSPYVAVWFSDNRESLEKELIGKLKPRYNIQRR